jgi:hypothetical protein
MIAIGALGWLIAFFGLVSGLTLGATNAIQQIYAALLIISGVLGLVIVAVAAGAVQIRTAIQIATKAAADDRRQLFVMLRDATFTVKTAARMDDPQGEWVEVERGEARSTSLANSLIKYSEEKPDKISNPDRQATFVIAVVVISIFVGVIILYMYISK